MNCPKCNVEIKPGINFCGFCGIKIDTVSEMKPDLEIISEEKPENKPGTASILIDEKNRVAIDKEMFFVGRTEENDYILNREFVSRKHFVIRKNEDHFTLTDLKTTNGTMVNGNSVKEVILNDNDLIEIGTVKIRFVCQ